MIGLVDCNSFFASCEQVFRPDLIGKPVVVLSNNDGCVVSRSREAKILGIPMGEAFFKIKRLVESGGVHVFSGNYNLYGNLSRRIMRILGSLVPDVEVYSIDEAFFKIQECSTEEATRIARHIEKTIKQVHIQTNWFLKEKEPYYSNSALLQFPVCERQFKSAAHGRVTSAV